VFEIVKDFAAMKVMEVVVTEWTMVMVAGTETTSTVML